MPANADKNFIHQRPVPPPLIDLEMLNGIWTVSFGRFGWKEYETRGAIMRIEDGQIFGGGNNFVYRGSCVLEGIAFKVRLAVDRYRPDPNFESVTGLESDNFRMDFIADAMTIDHLEGHIRIPGRPEVRVAMRRFDQL